MKNFQKSFLLLGLFFLILCIEFCVPSGAEMLESKVAVIVLTTIGYVVIAIQTVNKEFMELNKILREKILGHATSSWPRVRY